MIKKSKWYDKSNSKNYRNILQNLFDTEGNNSKNTKENLQSSNRKNNREVYITTIYFVAMTNSKLNKKFYNSIHIVIFI